MEIQRECRISESFDYLCLLSRMKIKQKHSITIVSMVMDEINESLVLEDLLLMEYSEYDLTISNPYNQWMYN